jgi:hypothetical protein
VRVPDFGLATTAALRRIVRTRTDARAGTPRPRPAYGLDESIRYDSFATDHADFLTWVDKLIYAIRLPRPFAIVVVGTLPFLVGIAIAVPLGFAGYFIKAPAVYLGCTGFALVVSVLNWGSKSAHRTYEQLRPIFTVQDTLYKELLVQWFRIMSSTRRAVVFSLVLSIAIILYVALAYNATHSRAGLDLSLPGTNLLTPEWYVRQHRMAAVLILTSYGIIVLIALGTTIRILAINILFLLRLGKLPVIPMPTLVRARLRRVVDLHVGVSVMWTAGVGLFGILFYRHYNAFSLSVIVLLFLPGTLTFAVPQMISFRYVNKSYERLCSLALARVYAGYGVILREQEQPDLAVTDLLPTSLAELAQLTERPRTWVYDAQDVFLWLASQAIALAVVFAI